MFTQPVLDVSNTKIFGRLNEGYQYLAYQMNFQANTELAMILPIPTPENPDKDAVQFFDFTRQSNFFDHLHQLFVERTRSMTLGYSKGLDRRSMLKVHDVGNFRVTFIPTVSDFDRVDKQFKFDTKVWENLLQYNGWSFIVFKLKPDVVTVHPMVFKFPSRYTDRVYFPTMHIHDGEIHEVEKFDHKLYYQPEWTKTTAYISKKGWDWSKTKVHNYMGILKEDFPLFRKEMYGNLANEDQWVMEDWV